MHEVTPVILCGGSGTRLWPLSRPGYPKQFAPLFGHDSLFRQTLRRLSGPGFVAPLIVTGQDFRFLARAQLDEAGVTDAGIVLEPEGRNTGPSVLSAALSAQSEPERLLLLAPSDHLIRDVEGFRRTVSGAIPAALAGEIVCFGTRPDRAETGYGYVCPGSAVVGGCTRAERFVEKPDHDLAEMLIWQGALWNCGVYLARVQTLLDQFECHAPRMFDLCRQAVHQAGEVRGQIWLAAEPFGLLPGQSIDKAVIEKCDRLCVIPMACDWTDLGSWDAVHRTMDRDDRGVATRGSPIAHDCRDSLLLTEDENVQLIGLGLLDITVVAMCDAVLVAANTHVQELKTAVGQLREQVRGQPERAPRHYRPWGWYECLGRDGRFLVKRICVTPAGRLSLQSHVHRAEHWVVVRGTARVVVGERISILSENESTFIAPGELHRLENIGRGPLELIEVQTGSLLSEDDIVRTEDVYDRV